MLTSSDLQRIYEDAREAATHGTLHDDHVAGLRAVAAAALAAAPQGEPVAFHELLREAEAEVRAKPVWKRYIDGTPLANDVPVWMAVFAQHHARTAAPPAPAAQPSADLEHLRALLADSVQYVTDDGLRAAIHDVMGDCDDE